MLVRDIRRATRKHYSAEDKIRIVLEGLRDDGQHRRAVPP
jgi:transposase